MGYAYNIYRGVTVLLTGVVNNMLNLFSRCSLRSECDNPDEELRWLGYTGIQCTKIIHVVPEQVQIQYKEERSKVTLKIRQALGNLGRCLTAICCNEEQKHT